MRHKVIFFAPVPFFKGGAENSLQDLMHNPAVEPVLVIPAEGPLADKARNEGIRVGVLELGAVAEIHRPLRIMPMLQALRDSFRAANSLKDLARREGVVCVHSNGMKAHFLACFSRLLGGAPVVCHVRDIAYTRLERLVWKALAVMADRVVMVSRVCWPEARLPGNVLVIHNGISGPKGKLPVPPGVRAPLRVGFAGRVAPIKGIELLLEWVAAAKEAGESVTLAVRGEGTSDHPDYPKQMEVHARALGLDARICKFEGKVSGLAAIYKDLDVIVVPSQVPDPLPRSVMEAMAMGVPVIGYPAGGIPEQIEDGVDGFLVKDSEGFVRAVKELRQPKRWLALQEAGRDKVAREFSLEHLYTQLNRIYGELDG